MAFAVLNQIIHQELHHAILHLCLDGTLTGSSTLGQEGFRISLYIHQAATLLKISHLTFNITKLLMDELNT